MPQGIGYGFWDSVRRAVMRRRAMRGMGRNDRLGAMLAGWEPLAPVTQPNFGQNLQFQVQPQRRMLGMVDPLQFSNAPMTRPMDPRLIPRTIKPAPPVIGRGMPKMAAFDDSIGYMGIPNPPRKTRSGQNIYVGVR